MLVWTSVLWPGYRPANLHPTHVAALAFTAMITLVSHGKGTKYTAIALHKDEAGRKKHAEMGFHDGWGKALDQLVAHMKAVR